MQVLFKNAGHRVASQQQALFSELAKGPKSFVDIRQGFTKVTLDGLAQKSMVTSFEAPIVAGSWQQHADYWANLTHARANVEQAFSSDRYYVSLEQYGAFLLRRHW